MPQAQRQGIFILLAVCVILIGSCSQARVIPADFEFIIDIRAEVGSAQNINIKINSLGKSRFEYYNTGGAIQYNTNDMVIYEAHQVVKTGEFILTDEELRCLWDAINENNFF